MATMEVRGKVMVNPELESLRLKALNSVHNADIESEIDELIQRTSMFHAAYLFHSQSTLQTIIRSIAETNSRSFDMGWQGFGDKLGLDVTILKIIDNCNLNHEDPVYNTLLAYVQSEDATIGKIISALKVMGRIDVIMRAKEGLKELTKKIFVMERERRLHLSGDTSDYGSLSSNESSSDMPSIDDSRRDVILHPPAVPIPPFILKNIPAESPIIQAITCNQISNVQVKSSTHTLLQASPVVDSSRSTTAAPQTKQKYGKKVLLTFSEDGAEAAQSVSEIFRRQREDMGRIGVLILGEQMNHLNADPLHFIKAAFFQVDYVIPILTEGYLKSVLRRARGEPGPNDCVDAHYVPYIFSLMKMNYVQNNCLNNKVRCIVPDASIDKVFQHLMISEPFFSAWERASYSELLAERILKSQA